MSNKNVRKCRFVKCAHKTRDIDITKESFVKDGSMYYHNDCYKLKQSNEWKDKQTRQDLTEFRDLWCNHISRTVNYGQLMRILNDYIARGVSSDYLLFTLKYCIKNRMNLNYPNGFKYYVDRADIKRAYDKYLVEKSSANQQKVSVKDREDNAPKFNMSNKPKGFQSILQR